MQKDGWGGVFVVRIRRSDDAGNHRSRLGRHFSRCPIGPRRCESTGSRMTIHRRIIAAIAMLLLVTANHPCPNVCPIATKI
jgi:hypothetical protein